MDAAPAAIHSIHILPSMPRTSHCHFSQATAAPLYYLLLSYYYYATTIVIVTIAILLLITILLLLLYCTKNDTRTQITKIKRFII